MICKDKAVFDKFKQKPTKEELSVYLAFDFSEAVRKLSKENTFLLITIWKIEQDNFSFFK